MKSQALPKGARYALMALVLGCIMLGASVFIAQGVLLEPVAFEVDLKPGSTRSPPFRVYVDADYAIDLEVQRNLPLDILNCLLGIDPGGGQPCDSQSPVLLNWTISAADGIWASGTSADWHTGAWGSTVSRTIGGFSGKRGLEYVLEIHSLTDASALTSTEPQVVLRMNPLRSKGYLLTSYTVAWLGIAVVCGALVALFVSKRRQNSSADGVVFPGVRGKGDVR